MKRKTIIGFSLCVLLILMSFSEKQDAGCNAKILKERTKASLDPFKYDSAEMTRIQYRNKETIKEVEVPLFIGEKYRVVFLAGGINGDGHQKRG